jgi:hypothetical protein
MFLKRLDIICNGISSLNPHQLSKSARARKNSKQTEQNQCESTHFLQLRTSRSSGKQEAGLFLFSKSSRLKGSEKLQKISPSLESGTLPHSAATASFG